MSVCNTEMIGILKLWGEGGRKWIRGERKCRWIPLLPSWSATEQAFSIRLCSEVTNCELPQMQAKSDSAQPVAEMPASVADDWSRCVRTVVFFLWVGWEKKEALSAREKGG